MNVFADRRGRVLLALAVGMFALLFAVEASKPDEPMTLLDALGEILTIALLVGCSGASALLLVRMSAQEEESQTLKDNLASVRVENRQWRERVADHLRELASAIHRQFEIWRLTPAEQDVALLLLKGFSYKEIARLRTTSEPTIRQQAASIYQKAGLSGRAALSAFFLDDLLSHPGAADDADVVVNGRDADARRLGPIVVRALRQ